MPRPYETLRTWLAPADRQRARPARLSDLALLCAKLGLPPHPALDDRELIDIESERRSRNRKR